MTKHNGKFVAYYRVSTDRQGVSGLGLEAQRDTVVGWLNGGRWTLVGEQVEVESGRKNDRPALAEALRLCQLYRATLIIAKLDRLARNVHFISSLMESGVEFVAVDFPQANRLTVHILAAVAEHEAEAISQRTKAALAVRRVQLAKEGKRLGTTDPDRIKQHGPKARAVSIQVRQEKARKRALQLMPVVEAIRARGITTQAGIAEELNAAGLTTPREKSWTQMAVKLMLQHAANAAAADGVAA